MELKSRYHELQDAHLEQSKALHELTATEDGVFALKSTLKTQEQVL